ncbi:CBS domain-containing protein [Gordonia rubripertincta]|uniref:HPP family protein n=1 Tax=Gordonia rubripertincta TaxID=36822 RepID=A0AAW4G1F8_GORRU|nr:HPP family protein [Gordonia rubripertincta]MBM7276943.1 HPP family protein [Gordonia rubripertincta]TSD97750.1 CBS domain-containing protein [Gordonia rubripertincta]
MAARMTDRLRGALQAWGPSGASVSPREAARAGVGSALGLALVGLVLATSGTDLTTGLFLIAPFGASAVLLFAAPNSPLAQPWSAVIGNTVSAFAGVAVTLLVSPGQLRVPLAVGVAVVAMVLCRAVHPPGGAVAMTAGLSPDLVHALGFRFALAPVAVGTIALVALAAVYARVTGRRYPARRFDDESSATARIGLDEAELTDILDRYSQSLNLGVADLARLIGAAELQVAGHRADPLVAGDVMSRDLVTVGPDSTLTELAQMFDTHRFTSLPVVTRGGRFLGVVFQIHLVSRLRGGSARRGSDRMFGRLLRRDGSVLTAADVMDTTLPIASPDAPVTAVLPMLAGSDCDAVPVLDGDLLVGIVTQTDLIAALARQTLADPLVD